MVDELDFCLVFSLVVWMAFYWAAWLVGFLGDETVEQLVYEKDVQLAA